MTKQIDDDIAAWLQGLVVADVRRIRRSREHARKKWGPRYSGTGYAQAAARQRRAFRQLGGDPATLNQGETDDGD